MLDLLDAATVALPELVEVLEVLIPEVVVLVLGAELEVGERGRESRMVRAAMGRRRTRGWRRVWAVYGQEVALGIDGRCIGRNFGGSELHGRGPLLPATRGHRRDANGFGLGLRGWLGDIELESLEVALLAHGTGSGGCHAGGVSSVVCGSVWRRGGRRRSRRGRGRGEDASWEDSTRRKLRDLFKPRASAQCDRPCALT